MERITKVSIRSADSPFGNKGAWVELEDEGVPTSSGLAFVWSDTRISFSENELIGLTMLEAHRLRHAKNRATANRVTLYDPQGR